MITTDNLCTVCLTPHTAHWLYFLIGQKVIVQPWVQLSIAVRVEGRACYLSLESFLILVSIKFYALKLNDLLSVFNTLVST